MISSEPIETSDNTRETADCSNAEILDVKVMALTSGDTYTVSGVVHDTPAPQLRGEFVEPNGERETVTRPLNQKGAFEFNFYREHLTTKEYEFWLDGCSSEPISNE